MHCRIRNTTHLQKITEDDLISCCRKLVKEGYDPSDPSTCEEWTDLVDRGRLWHIRETTFQLLCALEEEIRTYLDALSSPNAADLRTLFVEKLIKSEDVQFYCCITTADFEVDDVEVHDHLLKMIVELSGDFLMQEHYKQSEKKSTQRSKSLRKELYTDHNSSTLLCSIYMYALCNHDNVCYFHCSCVIESSIKTRDSTTIIKGAKRHTIPNT